MKNLAILTLLAICFVTTPVLASELDSRSISQTLQGAAYVPGELLVKYRPSFRAAASEGYRAQWGVSILRTFGRIGVQHVKLPKGMTVQEALQIYRSDPDVEYAEPNYYRFLMATPNDTYFGRLWGLNNTGQKVNGTSGTADADMDAPTAWDISTGSSSVVVAVIDSGVDYHHPDLSANIWTNPGEIAGNGIDDDGNGYVDDIRGWDFINNDNTPMDSNEHGTHVSGTIAAVGNNATGVAGVSWKAKVMVLRIFNAIGLGTTADEISAIEYADAKGGHVINMSLGGAGFSQAEKDAIDASSAVVVCAAGNDGTDNDSSPQYPASYDSTNIIAVAATNQDDDLASFSNYGATSVDVAAPGTNIYSCKPGRQTVWSDNFDDNDITDWTTGGTNNTWGNTDSLSYSGSYSLTDSPAGDYQDNTDSWARAPVLDLSSYSGAKLEFLLNGESEYQIDFLYVQASTDLSTWTDEYVDISLPDLGISGSTSGMWLSAAVDLGAYDGKNTVHIRFRFVSDDSVTYDGWYIDDVKVTAASSAYDGTEYQYLDGTSMAAPHVSGLTALIKGRYPSMTTTKIKTIIESTAESKTALSGKLVTGGRVNARNTFPLPAGSPSATRVDSGGCFIATAVFGSPVESHVGGAPVHGFATARTGVIIVLPFMIFLFSVYCRYQSDQQSTMASNKTLFLNHYKRIGKAMLKKASLVLFGLLLAITNYSFAYARNDLFKDNSLSLKVGYHLYPDSDFMDRWTAGEDDFNGMAFEIDYDRRLTKNISIGSSLGLFSKENKCKNVLFVNDCSTIDIENYYLSLTAKCHVLIGNSFALYIGLGPDFYHTKGDYRYEIGSSHFDVPDSFYTFGLHGLVGFEWIFYKTPQRRGTFHIPVGVFIEYKYSWAEVKDADKKLMNGINGTFSLGLPSNDLDIGGQMILLGLRWHF